ncbi:acyl--CoA ligase [Candidatus Poribacteria bacterium]|nr:acyl--CoA ligase [Candidatus Poribacteria bacterium]
METIINVFDEKCKKYNSKPACIYKNVSMSYSMLHDKVNHMAYVLSYLGVKPQDRVAIMISKRPEFLITYLAAIKIGAVNVPLNYKLTAKELANPIISTIQPAILICEYELLDKVRDIKDIIDLPKILVVNEGEHEYISYNKLEMKISSDYKFDYICSPEDTVAIQFTSGTTSFPKGACWNHTGILTHTRAMIETYNITENDNWLVLLPSFLSSHNSFILPIMSGATSILMENNNPEKILQNIEKYNVNIIMCAAVVCLMLLNLTEPAEYNIKSLRLVIPGGMRFPLKDLIEFEKKFNTSVMDVLAMTEMGIYLSNTNDAKRYGSIGKPIKGVEAKVVNEHGIELANDNVGEIVVQAQSMFSEYYKLPKETYKFIKDGWFYTGDLGWKDKDGFFYHVSRKSEMINVGGYKIFPQEVEELLLSNENISEVAVASAHDPIRGEIPKVFVVLKQGIECSKAEIIKFCRKKIANYKIPKIVKFCESLPKTGSGKICRKALLEW